MVTLKVLEKPRLRAPVLIEGLPGIGFVANLATYYLMKKLGAKPFCRVLVSDVRDLVFSDEGVPEPPSIGLYYSKSGARDFVYLFGNTQPQGAETTYKLCDLILSVAQELGVSLVVCMGGLRGSGSDVYGTALDVEALENLFRLGVKTLEGRVVGVAGVLLGLAALKGMQGICVLAETPTYAPYPPAAKRALEVVLKFLGLSISLEDFNAVLDPFLKKGRRIYEQSLGEGLAFAA